MATTNSIKTKTKYKLIKTFFIFYWNIVLQMSKIDVYLLFSGMKTNYFGASREYIHSLISKLKLKIYE